MRVLHVITGLGQGGAEGVLFRLLSNKEAHDEHFVISLGEGGFYKSQIEALGVSVFELGMSGVRGKLVGLVRLFCLFRRLAPDVVQTWMYHADLLGGLVGWFSRVPVVWGIRQSEVNLRSVSLATYLLCRVNALLSWVVPTLIVNCSKHSINVHSALGYKRSLFRFVPNGYVTDVSLVGNKLSLPDEINSSCQFVVGHAGRVDPVKNHALFIRSVKESKSSGIPVFGVLVGKGTEHLPNAMPGGEEYKSSGFHFFGAVSDMGPFYRTCDCLILSSDWEGFPNVVAEAMTYGVPCIVTAVGDAANIVGDTGWVVPVGDQDAMVQAIERAFREFQCPSAWLQRCDAARRRVIENFSIIRMSQNFEEVWRVALGAK